MARNKLPEVEFKWTPELAYAVGLLVTDGNLSPDGRHISMRSAEICMLQTFKKCLGLNNKIGSDKKGCYSVQFGNVQFYKWLLKIGLYPAKSYTIGAIAVPDKLFRDYFRGCLDGDGNVQTYIDQYNFYRGRKYTMNRLFIRIISASQKHILWLHDKTKIMQGIDGAVIKRPPATRNRVPTWELKYAKTSSLKLIKWIYYKKNIPCLERKRKAAKKAELVISKIKRRRYSFV